MNEIVNFLKKNPLFSSLNFTNKKVQKLISRISIKEFPKYTKIYEEGQLAENIYMVLSGEVGIYASTKNINIDLKQENKELQSDSQLISVHGKGSIFGEVSFLAGETHSSTAISLTKTKILMIPGIIFLEFLELDHQLSKNLIHLLSSRFRQRIGNIEAPHIGKIFSCLYPDLPHRNFMMIRILSYVAYKEMKESVVVLYFRQGMGKDEENKNLFENLYFSSNEEYILDCCEDLFKNKNVVFLNGISLIKNEFNENKLIDFLSILRRTFPAIFIETPSIDYYISHVFLRICDNILFFHRFNAMTIALKELYLEQLKKQEFLDKQNKIIFIYEKSVKEKTPFQDFKKETTYYTKTLVEENLEPNEDKSIRRFVRVILNRSRGLSLGGGGARAFAHVGCLEVFESEQIEFDAVIGSSMGAVIGSLYCMGKTAIEIRKLIEKYLSKSEYVFDKYIPTVSFFKGKKLNSLLDKVFEDIRIEELEIPFYCTATDLVSGSIIVFDKGFLDFALRCSVSLPGIYPPIKFGEYVLVDGSVLNNLPGEVLKLKGYSKTLGINVTPLVDPTTSQTEIEKEKGLKGVYEYYSLPPILNIISRSIAIQGRELLKFQMQYFNFILHPDIKDFGLFDFHLYDQIIQKGREEALDKIQNIKEIFLE